MLFTLTFRGKKKTDLDLNMFSAMTCDLLYFYCPEYLVTHGEDSNFLTEIKFLII